MGHVSGHSDLYLGQEQKCTGSHLSHHPPWGPRLAFLGTCREVPLTGSSQNAWEVALLSPYNNKAINILICLRPRLESSRDGIHT